MLDSNHGTAAVKPWEQRGFPDNLRDWVDRYQQVG